MSECKVCGFDPEEAQRLWTILRERCEKAEAKLAELEAAARQVRDCWEGTAKTWPYMDDLIDQLSELLTPAPEAE